MVNASTITSSTFVKMIQMGATNLRNHRNAINKLNVFPVPDGDTGTNMNLSMTTAVNEIEKLTTDDLSTILNAFMKGLLMGARGNSGVLLSQLFRGFSQFLVDEVEITPINFAQALDAGVKTAYDAVTTPVEGTILTVAKDIAKVARDHAETSTDMIDFMEKIVAEARFSLQRTPDLLPILKEVGVVDSGGKGLVVIFEGFLAALKGEELPEVQADVAIEESVEMEHDEAVQSYIDKDTIEYGYCTEFFIEFDEHKLENRSFQEDDFRNELSEYGDSLLVAADEKYVKVHIHTEFPGKVMTIAQRYGELINIDIENMRKQYDEIVHDHHDEVRESSKYGIIVVAQGSGMKEMFLSIGATKIVEGGQTMNPSTEDILRAIEHEHAEHIFVLPNNSNIVMTVQQAIELTDKSVSIIPSKTIPQGVSALFSFDSDRSVENNEANMIDALADVKTGLVTYATRDTVINEMEIKEGSFIGMNDNTIKVTNPSKLETIQSLLTHLIAEDDEIVTVFYGEDVTDEEVASLKRYVEEKMDAEVEFEFHHGNQPIYSFIVMVE